MRRKPQFRPRPGAGPGQCIFILNGKMRTVLAQLFTGLTDADIRRLAGPVESAVKALGEALARAAPPPGRDTAVVTA